MGLLREAGRDIRDMYREGNIYTRRGMIASAIGATLMFSGIGIVFGELIDDSGQPIAVGTIQHEIPADVVTGGAAFVVGGVAFLAIGGARENRDGDH